MDAFHLLKFTRRSAALATIAAATATPAVADPRLEQKINAAADRMREVARAKGEADPDDVIARLIWENEGRWAIEHWRLLAAAALVEPPKKRWWFTRPTAVAASRDTPIPGS